MITKQQQKALALVYSALINASDEIRTATKILKGNKKDCATIKCFFDKLNWLLIDKVDKVTDITGLLMDIKQASVILNHHKANLIKYDRLFQQEAEQAVDKECEAHKKAQNNFKKIVQSDKLSSSPLAMMLGYNAIIQGQQANFTNIRGKQFLNRIKYAIKERLKFDKIELSHISDETQNFKSAVEAKENELIQAFGTDETQNFYDLCDKLILADTINDIEFAIHEIECFCLDKEIEVI